LENLHFRGVFRSKADEVENSIRVLTAACDQIKQSQKFKRLLEVILAIGNVVNSGTLRGGAYGFKLDSLIKLRDVRSTNPNIPTLMHFVADKCEQLYPDVLDISSEMSAVATGAKENFGQIGTELTNFAKSLRTVKQELIANKIPFEDFEEKPAEEENKEGGGAPPPASSDGNGGASGGEITDKYLKLMKQFYDNAALIYKVLKTKNDKLIEKINDVVVQYGEREGTNINDFLTIVAGGIGSFEQCAKENKMKRDAVKKQKEAEERREKMKNQVRSKPKGLKPGEGGDAGVMDNLVGALNSGTAFQKRNVIGQNKETSKNVANEVNALFAKMQEKKK